MADLPDDDLNTIRMNDDSLINASSMPERIGKYPLRRPLGRGGMGIVYLAEHPELQVPVAIKMLPRELHRHDPQFGDRFLEEARLMARVSHANIVRVFDVGEADQTQFLVMEYLSGGSTRDLLRCHDQLPITDVLRIGTDVAKALQAADRHSIVHRDIKPDNILLDDQGHAKLADLGLAKSLELARDSGLTTTGISMGTPHYMAPEQAKSAKHADKRADIYSLGATLYHLLTGAPPYDDETAVGVILKHCNDPVPSARALRPEVPQTLDQLLQEMMAKEPADRPADATAVLARLEAATLDTPTRRFRNWKLALAGGLLAVLAAALFALWQPNRPATTNTAPSSVAQPGQPTLGPVVIEADFTASDALDEWQRLRASEEWAGDPIRSLDVGETRQGWLTVEPRTSAWYQDLRGALLYQTISGDVVITTRVAVQGLDSELPTADFSMAGPMLRAPGTTENTTWLAIGTERSIDLGPQFEFKNTRDGGVTPRFIPSGSRLAELRLVRIGPHVLTLTKLPHTDWQLHARWRRDDFPPTLQAGLAFGSDYSGVDRDRAAYRRGEAEDAADFVAQVDYFRAQRIDDISPEQVATATDQQLEHWFGEGIPSLTD